MIVASLLLIFAAVVLLVVGVAGHSDPALIGSIVGTLMAVVVLIASARRAATVRLAAAADGTGVDPTVHSGPSAGVVIDGTVVERPAGRSAGRQANGSSVPEGTAAADPMPDGVLLLDFRDDDGRDDGLNSDVLDGGLLGGDAEPAPVPTRQRPAVDPDPIELDDSGDDEVRAGDLTGDGELDDFEDDDPPDEPPAQLISAGDQALIADMVTHVLVVDGRPRYHLARCPHLRGRETEPVPVREAVELGFTPCSRCEPATALLAGARQN